MRAQDQIQQAKRQRNLGTGAESAYSPEEVCCALVRAAGASFTNTGARGQFAAATGTNGVTRISAGLYTLTLARAIPSAQCNLIPTIYGTVQGSIVVSHTSDTVKTISTFNNASPGLATDFDFDLVVRQIAPF
jgi:hypothetical protein